MHKGHKPLKSKASVLQRNISGRLEVSDIPPEHKRVLNTALSKHRG